MTLEGFPWERGEPGLLERLEQRYREAYSLARRLGRLVGRTSRYAPVETGPGKRVVVEVSPETYFERGGSPVQRVGDYLVAVDPKTMRLVLLRVAEIRRLDALAMIGAEPPVSGFEEPVDPSGAATRTVIDAEPLVEAPPGPGDPPVPSASPVPAVTSVEPQAPVVEPLPEVLEALLGLPGEGLLLGVLSGPWGPLDAGIPVRLPYKAVLQHVLVVGTTGSGKTTLIKNVVAALYSESRPEAPVVVSIDLNQDYVQLPFPGDGELPSWAERAYRRVRHPSGAVVVVPVTRDILEETGAGPCNDYSGLYEWYADRFISPLAGTGWRLAERVGGALPRGVVEAGGARIVLVPYAIDTTRSGTDELLGLLPGMTLLARELLRRVRYYYMRRHHPDRRVLGPPLPVLASAMLEYLAAGRERRREEMVDGTVRQSWEYFAGGPDRPDRLADARINGVELAEAAETVMEALERARHSDKTVEALYRRVSGLLESGLVDLAAGCGGRLALVAEPGWESIVSLASDTRLPIVVDLKPASESGMGGYEGPRAVAYRMLQRLIAWKQRAYAQRKRTPNLLVILDEAHQFFPQEKGPREEQEANRQVASMISRIARLGRARGIGLLFATHSPRDLHDIIVQLSNTKIVLRMERGQVEKLSLPPELAQLVPRFPDRMLAVLGHSYREGYVLATTPPPLVRHYDVSALI